MARKKGEQQLKKQGCHRASGETSESQRVPRIVSYGLDAPIMLSLLMPVLHRVVVLPNRDLLERVSP